MRTFSRKQWLWYVIYPLGISASSFAVVTVLGLFTGMANPWGLSNTIIIVAGIAIATATASWWINHFGKAVEKRMTNVSASLLFVNAFLAAITYAVPVEGTLFFALSAIGLIFFATGFMCAFYWLGFTQDERGGFSKGQKIILWGVFFFTYVYFGLRGVRNIASEVFRIQVPSSGAWVLGMDASAALGTVLLGVGVLTASRHASVAQVGQEPESKETWGQWIQELIFPITMLGVILSGTGISSLGGMVVIVIGLLCYPAGRLVNWLVLE